ncbi:hypothetical Protein YC6258_05838 [Gynuella sunshinyii YC6258]|uniref:Uncharacterized protein n=1 Tax=Gynuella sunshinyii YC6258 TaxID=1445510 RepID=A0A0C5VUN9_9GAMM|nr:hypothetical Protein YC6258_05838 [Gynuella sunshinyii YC6258]
MLIVTQVAFGAVVILSGNKFMGVLLYSFRENSPGFTGADLLLEWVSH